MRRLKKRLTVEQSIEVARRFNAGERAVLLAEEFEISASHVRRITKTQHSETAKSAFRSEVFHFRAARQEVEGFDAAVEGLGFDSRSAAFRALLRNAQGLATVFRTDLLAFGRIALTIEKPAVNVNQIARKVNRGILQLSAADRAVLNELLKVNQEIKRQLKLLDGRAYRAARDILVGGEQHGG